MVGRATGLVSARRGAIAAVASMVLAVALGGCQSQASTASAAPTSAASSRATPPAATASPGSAGPALSPKPLEQSFAPPYGAAPPSGTPQRLMDLGLSADHRTITVTFVGAAGYQPDDPCSADYQPWVGVTNGILQMVVAQTVPPYRLPVGTGSPDIACPAIGYTYVFRLGLSAPYDGAEIDDQAGTRFWVAAPPGLAAVHGLPTGWSLQAGYTEPDDGSSMYVRAYGASPLPTPASPFQDRRLVAGPGLLLVYQAFGAPAGVTIGDPTAEQISVVVHGERATLYHQPQYGELLVTFLVGGDGIALDASDADFTPTTLVALANAVTAGASMPPTPATKR